MANYYRPGTGWAPRLWKRFDANAARQDFARMKALGVNCVRVFLSHGSFFMEPDALLPEGLAKFDQLLAIAEEAGIYVHPTGPDGWEEFPAWAQCNRIVDDQYLTALETFWRRFGRRYRDRSVIFAYDLRNEPGVGWNDPMTLTKWNEWLQSRYGSAEKTAKASSGIETPFRALAASRSAVFSLRKCLRTPEPVHRSSLGIRSKNARWC
jgi:endo-1,4-beta-mannosidase